MEPEKLSPKYEEEIAMISSEIAEKRAEREHEPNNKAFDQGETIAREVISNTLRKSVGEDILTEIGVKKEEGAGYFDTADPETIKKVNELIELIHKKGLAEAITEARESSPYVLDIFHDSLVEKLYTELIEKNLI